MQKYFCTNIVTKKLDESRRCGCYNFVLCILLNRVAQFWANIECKMRDYELHQDFPPEAFNSKSNLFDNAIAIELNDY